RTRGARRQPGDPGLGHAQLRRADPRGSAGASGHRRSGRLTIRQRTARGGVAARYGLAVATIWQLITERAAALPDRTILIAEDDSRITYAEFRDRAERVAAGLAGLGIGSETRVTWQLPSCIPT